MDRVGEAGLLDSVASNKQLMMQNRLQENLILIVISLLLSIIEILAKTTGSILFPQKVFNSSMICQRAVAGFGLLSGGKFVWT